MFGTIDAPVLAKARVILTPPMNISHERSGGLESGPGECGVVKRVLQRTHHKIMIIMHVPDRVAPLDPWLQTNAVSGERTQVYKA
jgi:hypothetical protein